MLLSVQFMSVCSSVPLATVAGSATCLSGFTSGAASSGSGAVSSSSAWFKTEVGTAGGSDIKDIWLRARAGSGGRTFGAVTVALLGNLCCQAIEKRVLFCGSDGFRLPLKVVLGK